MALTKVTYSMIANAAANVRDFGAIGNGVADDTAAIQAAINSGAPAVYIPQGTYLVRDATNVTSGVVLQTVSNQVIYGDGDASVLKLGAHSTTTHYVIRTNNTNNVTIQNLKIDGNKAQQSGPLDEFSHCIHVMDSQNIIINNCTLINSIGDGLDIYALSNGSTKNILVSGCKFDNNTRQGISIIRGADIRIIGNDIANTSGSAPGAGIDLEADALGQEVTRIAIVGNTIRGNFWGIAINDAAPTSVVTISANVFSFNRATDILCRGTNMNISDNVIYMANKSAATPSPAIDMYLASDIVVSGNVILGSYDVNERGGIRLLRDCRNIIVSNNSISNTHNSGILFLAAFVGGGASNSISLLGNTLYNCLVAGSPQGAINLQADGSGIGYTDVTVQNNHIYDARTVGDVADYGINLVNVPASMLSTWSIKDNLIRGTTYQINNVSGWSFAGSSFVVRAALDFDLTSVAYQDLTVTATGAAIRDVVTLGIDNTAAAANVLYWAWVSAADTVTVRAMRVSGTPNPVSATFNVMVQKLLTTN